MHFPLFRPLAPLAVRISGRFPLGAAGARLGFSTNAPAQHAAGSAQKHEPQPPAEELKGLYNMPQDHSHHGDPRKFINPDGTYSYPITSQLFHFEDPYSPVPKQQILSINGKKMIKGVEARSLVELFSIHQATEYSLFPKKAHERLRQSRLADEGRVPVLLDSNFHHLVLNK
ncbi:Cytochrome c oxidase subunit 2a, related [Eimeria necatrix]|uniref:Cytochrome c oxidase subunit 2a, related n=1 Tax=Eimeria necatrix TaxID=51315 RepID=U6MJI1_9EIME|nr:Cytochrome c oxidase subunit 2a, related [Eimeria necatrix]CDJ64171.1 Cytochrome c oxidase subunit 2a, related [Eimeria necatrix]